MVDEATGDYLAWRQGWLLDGPVLALTSIVAFFLSLTWQIEEYEEQLRRRAQAGLCVLLLLGVLALAVLAHHALFDADGRLAVAPDVSSWWRRQFVGGDAPPDTDRGSGTSPWAVAAAVAILLVLAAHKSSFQLFRPPFYLK